MVTRGITDLLNNFLVSKEYKESKTVKWEANVKLLKNCGIGNALDSAKYKAQLDDIRSSERMLQTVVIKILQDSIIIGSFILYCHSVEQLYLIYDIQNLRAS